MRTCAFILWRTWLSLRRHALLTITATAVISVSLSLLGMSFLAERNIKNLKPQTGTSAEMIVYLTHDARAYDINVLRSSLERIPAVMQVHHVSSANAMEYLQSFVGTEDPILDGLEPGFLPASLEVTFAPGVKGLLPTHPMVERLQSSVGVDEVVLTQNNVANVPKILGHIRGTSVWAALVATVLGIFTIVVSLHLSADTRLGEEQTYLLLGAPNSLCIGPLLVEGALLGLLGALGAIAILSILFHHLGPIAAMVISSALHLVSTQAIPLQAISLQFLDPRDLAQLCVMGPSIGVVAALIASSRSRQDILSY